MNLVKRINRTSSALDIAQKCGFTIAPFTQFVAPSEGNHKPYYGIFFRPQGRFSVPLGVRLALKLAGLLSRDYHEEGLKKVIQVDFKLEYSNFNKVFLFRNETHARIALVNLISGIKFNRASSDQKKIAFIEECIDKAEMF